MGDYVNLSVTIPSGVFGEQSSQKTRGLWREIMQSMSSVHCGACSCEGTEQLHFFFLKMSVGEYL